MMLDEARLMAEASAATGLADFGGEQFRKRLRILLADLDAPGLSGTLRDHFLADWRGRLETRLKLMAVRAANPAVATQRIERPLIVTGLPRTGTTALIDLLAQDIAARVLYHWETAHLVPPADPDHWHDDPRIAATQAMLEAVEHPVVKAVVEAGLHSYGAMLPEECNTIQILDFWGARYPGEPEALHLTRGSDYIQWCTAERPYHFHKMVLQHLQAHGPRGRWTLKCPGHLFSIAEMAAEYDDARFIQTHRDPVATLTSLCGLTAIIRQQGPGHPGRPATGRYILERWGAALQRCLAARTDPAIDARFLDLAHRQIASEPLAAARTIYTHFDLPLSEETVSRMERWIAQPAQHESKTRFALADFGLTPDDVEVVIGPYRERFAAFF